MDDRWQILTGDSLKLLRTLPDASAQCCVTSPPYYGLRDYGHEGQIGLEQTPDAYVAALVAVFGEVRRVLRGDGTLWLNLGDCHASNAGARTWGDPHSRSGPKLQGTPQAKRAPATGPRRVPAGLKPKDLIGIPWRVAFALQAAGWYLRSDIIWHKPNPMPSPVSDRPTSAHEYVFLFSSSLQYHYDAKAIQEPGSGKASGNGFVRPERTALGGRGSDLQWDGSGVRNCRDVWSIAPQPFDGAHFATMPLDLARRCILAGCPEGATVLDPFSGAGTTGLAAVLNGRRYIGIELNPAYAAMSDERIREATRQVALFPVARLGVAS